MKRKGIILAGGSGTRLFPLTISVSKQLLPIYDKPMIYYPLTVLMLAGIRDILIITTPEDQASFQRLLEDGSQWGLNLSYKIQSKPEGLAQGFIIAEDFLNGAPSALILGDNIFFGNGLSEVLKAADLCPSGATVFGLQVANPERYGILGFDQKGTVTSIQEKPQTPLSNVAVAGLYFVDGTAPERAKLVEPSARGELEITSLLEGYLCERALRLEKMGRGYAWFDTGTHHSMLEASNFVRTMMHRQGVQIGSPEEIAYRSGWISLEQLEATIEKFTKSSYGKQLKKLVNELVF